MRRHKPPTWGGRQLPGHPSSHFGEVKTPESFRLKMQGQYTHIKEVKFITYRFITHKSQNGGTVSQGKGSPLCQVTSKQEREHDG